MKLAVVYEGDTDLPFVRKLALQAEFDVGLALDMSGKGRLDKEFNGFNDAAQGSPWLVLRDLDDDAACAPDFLRTKGWAAAEWMSVRLAVREVESWLLADREGVASFFGVRKSDLPMDTDALPDPTKALVDLCRRSRKPGMRRAMVPDSGRVTVGRLYEAMVIEFGSEVWDVSRAAAHSESLRRAVRNLRALQRRWEAVVRGIG
jgi:hypothetical protein